MKIPKALLPIGLALLFAGCDVIVPSLQPLYTKADLVFNPALVGRFDGGDGTIFTFEKSDDKAYKLTITEMDGDKVESGVFEAHLLKLQGVWFLDFYPEEPRTGEGFYNCHLMQTHSIAKVWIEDDALRISLLDSNWLRKQIDEGRIETHHEIVDDSVVLTATTSELQNLISRFAWDEEAFPVSDNDELLRLPADSGANAAAVRSESSNQTAQEHP